LNTKLKDYESLVKLNKNKIDELRQKIHESYDLIKGMNLAGEKENLIKFRSMIYQFSKSLQGNVEKLQSIYTIPYQLLNTAKNFNRVPEVFESFDKIVSDSIK